MGQLRNWIDMAIVVIDTASGRTDDEVTSWIGSIVYNPRTFLGLKEVPKKFRPLDKALASAMVIMISKAAQKRVPSEPSRSYLTVSTLTPIGQ